MCRPERLLGSQAAWVLLLGRLVSVDAPCSLAWPQFPQVQPCSIPAFPLGPVLELFWRGIMRRVCAWS